MTTTLAPDLAGALLTAAEVRALLKISDRTLYRYAERGQLVPLRLPGRQRRYAGDQVAELLDDGTGRAGPAAPAGWQCPVCEATHIGVCPRQGTLI